MTEFFNYKKIVVQNQVNGRYCLFFSIVNCFARRYIISHMIHLCFISLETRPAQTLLALEYHYLSDKCTEEIHDSIASNFIALYTTYLSTIGGCDENEECTIENVGVECGDQSGTLRRRDLADSEQASKVPLTVKFDLRVPLPSNASMVGLNETTEQISSDILASLNEAELTLNVSGVVLEYDSSKPPVVRIVGIVCDKGEVLKETHCGKN